MTFLMGGWKVSEICHNDVSHGGVGRFQRYVTMTFLMGGWRRLQRYVTMTFLIGGWEVFRDMSQ